MAHSAHATRDVGGEPAGTAPQARIARRGWSRSATLVLGGTASLLGLWTIVHPTLYNASGCLLVTMLLASRLWPKVLRLLLFAAVPYEITWTVFVTLRGLGDGSPIAVTGRLQVRRFEVWLFGGEMPTTVLQRHLFEPNHPRPYDYFFTAVHVSFFIVPFAAAMALWWVDAQRFRRFIVALVCLLTVGLPGFFLIPSNPPWMNPTANDSNPVPAERVNFYVARRLQLDAFEPDHSIAADANPLAAMPSIHMAVTFLIVLAAGRGRRWWRRASMVYAALMAFSLVYLGEHQVVDEIAGVAIAIGAWRAAPAVWAWLERRCGGAVTAQRAWLAELLAPGTRRVRALVAWADAR